MKFAKSTSAALLVSLAVGCAGEPRSMGPMDAGGTDGGPFFSPVATPFDRDDAPNLFDIWGAAPDALFAVGENATIMRFDGTTWSDVYNSTTTTSLMSIWGTDETNIYAVGEAGTILHFVGTSTTGRWVREDSSTRENLAAVHGSGEDNVWAVGANGTMLFRDPEMGWRGVNSRTFENLHGLWIGADDEGVAVGNLGVILRYNGSRWRRQRINGLTVPLRHVGGRNRGQLYIAGLDGTLLRSEDDGWREVDEVPAVYLRDVSALDSRIAWAVGWNGTILHLEGDDVTPLFSFTDFRLEGVWATLEPIPPTETPTTGETMRPAVYVVGVSGLVLKGP